MNVTPSVSNTPLPSDPLQFSAAASDSATPRADAQNFAGALSDAGRQPVHKNSPAKKAQAPPSGRELPVAGSQPPPQPAQAPPNPQPQPVTQSAEPPAGGAGIAATGTAGAGTAAAAAALPAVPGQTPAQTSSPVPPPPVAPLPGSAANTEDVTDSPDPTSAASQPQSQLPLPPATQTVATPAPAATQAASNPGAVAPNSAKPVDSIKAAAANVAATSGRSSDRGAPAPGASMSSQDTESAPQALMAVAAAQLTEASAPDAGAPKDDLATPDTGTAPPSAPASAPPVALPIAIAAAPKAPTPPVTSIAAAPAIASVARAASAQPRGNSSDAAADAAQLVANSGTSSATDATPMPTLKVAPSVDSAEFGQGVADRVSLMMDSNLTSAKLQVNPPALGPIEVRIALQAGHAQVWLTSHSAVTRDALESGSSSLREMLGAQGFGQVSVDISQRSFQERSSQFQSYEAPTGVRATDATTPASLQPTQRVTNGILDAYA
jgi:flagellar hook-length control protein FliK